MPKASDILAIARAELGYTENPRGSNRTKYGKWFGLDGNPGCMMFDQWCFAQAGASDLPPAYDSKESEEDEVVTYEKLKDMPEKFRPIIDKLMTVGIVQGDGSDATGNGDIINLTHEQVRTLVFIYRGGGFDRKMQAVGMETAV